MASPLYNNQGLWNSQKQYFYLDIVTYSNYFYICTAAMSQGDIPPTTSSVWYQVPALVQQDQIYIRSRESLLNYEDARFYSLVNSMSNSYDMRNDESIWGCFLRAISMEFARAEYMTSYSVVSKNSKYLTPPDIKRQYADPLHVTGAFQQLTQFDTGNFGTPFGVWSANLGFIEGAVIVDPNNNLQVSSGGISSTMDPLWATQLGYTTTDGSITWVNSGVAPPALAYPIGYKDMLLQLQNAYSKGSTAKSIQQVVYAYTGKTIEVEELYQQIVPGGFYDQSDRNTVKVDINIGGSDPLSDIQSLQELQQITYSLYGAVDLAKPAHVGLQLTTVFGADENVDCFISPRWVTYTQLNTLSGRQQDYFTLKGYVPLNYPAGWQSNTEYEPNSVVQDTNQNLQFSLMGGVSGNSTPLWSSSLQTTTLDGDLVWSCLGQYPITPQEYSELMSPEQAVFEGWYNNTCLGMGIDDVLTIEVSFDEEPPYDPMLYLAPIYEVANPQTVLSASGRRISSILSPSQWESLTTMVPLWSTSQVYPKGSLVQVFSYPQNGSWVTYRSLKRNQGNSPTASSGYWTALSSPSAYQAYSENANGMYTTGFSEWYIQTPYFAGQIMVDPNGLLQLATVGGVSSTSMVVDVTQQNEVVILDGLLTVKVVGAPTLTANQSYVKIIGCINSPSLNGGVYLVKSYTSNSVTLAANLPDYSSGPLSEPNMVLDISFSQTVGALTYDGSVVWQCLGANKYTDPSKWIQVVGNTGLPTGEVSNWDVNHPYGLVAPRLDLCWEISSDEDYSIVDS